VLLSSVLVSLVLTIVVGVLLKYLAGCVIVTSVLSVSVGGVITGYFLYTGSIGDEYRDTQKIMAFVLWSFVALFLLNMLCIINKIYLALEILDATVDVISDIAQLLLLPFFPLFLAILFLALWVIGILYIHASFGTLVSEPTPSELVGLTIHGQVISDMYMRYQEASS